MEGPDWKKNCLWAEPKLVCREDLELIKLEQATKFYISVATLFFVLPGAYTLSLFITLKGSTQVYYKDYKVNKHVGKENWCKCQACLSFEKYIVSWQR